MGWLRGVGKLRGAALGVRDEQAELEREDLRPLDARRDLDSGPVSGLQESTQLNIWLLKKVAPMKPRKTEPAKKF